MDDICRTAKPEQAFLKHHTTYSSSLMLMSVFFHWRAGMWRVNMMSISRYDRPFISGRQKYATTKQMRAVAPHTKPHLPPRLPPVGFSM